MHSPVVEHRHHLEHDEIRHGLFLSLLGEPGPYSFWSIGEPGACAFQHTRSLVLGDLSEIQCHKLAELNRSTPGVIGPDDTVVWYVEHANGIGSEFIEVEKHFIWSLRSQPRYPSCPGRARPASIGDLDLLLNWLPAFQTESNPHDPIPDPQVIDVRARSGDITLWIDRGVPVSMAGITRRLKHSAAITGVYTPPELRGHGYAGAVTAATVERIYQEGRKMASLYTDAANAASNRCYEKIGFIQECRSAYWVSR